MEMDKSVNNEMDSQNVEYPESVLLNSHIEQFIMLRKSVEKINRKVQHWRKQKSKLLKSNSNIEINYDKLRQKVFNMNEEMTENMKIHDIKKQEIKDFQSMRANTLHKQWDNSLSEIGNYANDFAQWITEYSRNVLIKNIKNHQEECIKISDELAVLKKELNDMRRECNLDHIKANVDVNDLPNLNNVISDIKPSNSNVMHIVTLTEDTINKIQSNIKRSKIAVNKYKTKEKINMF